MQRKYGGTWSVATNMEKSISLLAGIKKWRAKLQMCFTRKGSNLDYDALSKKKATMFGKTLHRDDRTSKNCGAENNESIGYNCCGSWRICRNEWESSSRTNYHSASSKDLLKLLKTGKPVVLVLFGRPLV
jgi:beta-glucosidase